MATYRSAAAEGFTLLTTQYKKCDFSGNFWFAGNTFHTCLDYMINAKVVDTTTGIVPYAYGVYEALLNQYDWWHDDYGWWGNAFVVALNNRGALGYGDPINNPLFDKIARAAGDCWQKLENNWGTLPFGSKSPDSKDHAAGSAAITGGTYNIAPGDGDDVMQGRNSVTNEGYWLLSLGLSGLYPTNPQYAQAAKDMQAWYQQWLQFPGVGLLNANKLVLERPTGNATAPDWYWSGDQGLLSHALYASGSNQKLALDIAFATVDKMKDVRGVLHENLGFVDKGLGQFLGDYATGKGIFMRGLAQVNVGAVRPFDDFIKRNAAAVWCSQDSGQFMFNWDLAPGYEPNRLTGTNQALYNVVMQAAGQDALNAALRFTPDAVINC